jgi:hypothetical protein
MWFLWLLLVGDIAAAGLYQLIAGRRETVTRLSYYARQHPARFLAGFALVSVLAYVPLALIFGPSGWFQRGPFSFQLSRPLHYAVYFFGGVVIGACGIERGLFAADGPLPGRWPGWLGAAAATFMAWGGLTGLVMQQGGGAPLWLQALDDLSFSLACFASCFFVLAAALRFGQMRARLLESLKANAYGMYLIHYVFIVWLQYAMLSDAGLPAVAKASIVFAGTLALSWAGTAALRRIPAVAQIIGADRRPAAAARRPAPAVGPNQGLAR